ncbi:Antifreeze-like/N-acetylneuraminic acid synthase C-terminal [Acididesulfobacillus acetoxydans]|uniref:Antifreeze-like/N-acetylneuraminic acid synthase C-terminal n=1 Tax=Acididesulfobacillus acetoxydans TaxID=1561005 RepID=A0A8S0WRA5_9FIRM|nr:N-acetylneuraminate synthase family protein [Acididesulfobacillus acetoxydans]CAA7603174.1 Antifreeze-like/N-acetylneuraminic acid synthase C-terminal [Acididesulfobacillus acetoxydans]CEJ07598.1 Elg4 [Acididesulfobacillus acetoxydans]
MSERHVMMIAEAGVNHNGSTDLALRLVEAAARAGADIVKFQSFKAGSLAAPTAPKAAYQVRARLPSESFNPAAEGNRSESFNDAAAGLNPLAAENASAGREAVRLPAEGQTSGSRPSIRDGESQLAMLKRLELTPEQHLSIFEHCRKMGIEFLSTPFEEESLRYLVQDLGVRQIKISSGDLTNGPLLLAAARTGRPVILSTGMGTLGEVEEALGVLAYGYLGRGEPAGHPGESARGAFQEAFSSAAGQGVLRERVTLLHCTTEYPAPYGDVNLKAMLTLKDAFGLPVGLSDHTAGTAVALGAVALGAVVIEKHFTLDRTLPGPDHKASLEPRELQTLAEGIRALEEALGSPRKTPAPSERKNRPAARKSLVALCRIEAGEVFTPENLGSKRPGGGMSPMEYWALLGKTAPRSFEENELVTLSAPRV